jgi:hypothetical protein
MKSNMLTRTLTVLFIVAFATINVSAQKKLDQVAIDQFGTKIFDKSKSTVFPIVRTVLKNNDFDFEFENFEKGKIKTRKKVIGTTGYAQGYDAAQFRQNFRQYIVQIDSLGPQQTRVVFTPKIWIGDADVSEQKIWVFKGAAGEIKLWENLFNSILEIL